MKKLFSVWFCIFTTVILTITCYGKELSNLQEDPFLLAKQQQHAVEIASSIREKFSDEKYGGMYIDEQNTLHVLIPRTKIKAMEFYDTDQENKTIFHYCQYSYAELTEYAQTLAEIMDELQLYALEVDEKENCIFAYQDVNSNFNEYKRSIPEKYLNLIESPMLIIQYKVNKAETTANTMQPGALCLSLSQEKFSLGFWAKSGNTLGMVTAGHAVDLYENVYIGSMSTKLGYVLKRKWDSKVDAAFIEYIPNAAINTSASIANTAYTITGYSTNITQGQTIYKSGGATLWTSGKITSLLHWYKDKTTGINTQVIKTNATCAPGDSGGPVIAFNGMNRYVVGIVQSRDEPNNSMNFCKVDTVLNQLVLTFVSRP